MNEKEEKNLEEREIHDELDEEALDVILRLYDKTMKDLVDR